MATGEMSGKAAKTAEKSKKKVDTVGVGWYDIQARLRATNLENDTERETKRKAQSRKLSENVPDPAGNRRGGIKGIRD
jgi:hypothetical protein